MDYKPKFSLPETGIRPAKKGEPGRPQTKIPPYIFSEKIAIAVDVARVTKRPLLISGPPGSGKSSLAPVMADILGFELLSYTLTSRSQLEDLTCDIDQMRRLSHAQVGESCLRPEWAYQKPGLFWWAFDPESAERRGGTEEEFKQLEEEYPENRLKGRVGSKTGVVILLDEIDKAEPDLPNDLLDPLDNRSFKPPITQRVYAPADLELLIIITTNQERDLPRAVIRRCVILDLEESDEEGDKIEKLTDKMVQIAKIHSEEVETDKLDDETLGALAGIFAEKYFDAKRK